MPKREKVPATSGQVGEIAGALIGEMNFSKDEAKAIVGKLGAFRKDARVFFAQYRTDDVVENNPDLIRWVTNYEKLFSRKLNLSSVVIPPKPEGLGPMRLIVVAKEIVEWTDHKPLQGTMNVLKLHFQCWQYANDLDEAISTNTRDPRNDSYAFWVKDVREADEENANLSANDLAKKNHLGITILERMLLEADYFFEYGEHMDQQNWTLCDGSRDSGGGVPSVGWGGGRFDVGWCDASGRNPNLRSRSVHV